MERALLIRGEADVSILQVQEERRGGVQVAAEEAPYVPIEVFL
jgi:hypothetical protein